MPVADVDVGEGRLGFYEWLGHVLLRSPGLHVPAGALVPPFARHPNGTGIHATRLHSSGDILILDSPVATDFTDPVLEPLRLDGAFLEHLKLNLSPLYVELVNRRHGHNPVPGCASGCPGEVHERSANCLDTLRVLQVAFDKRESLRLSIVNIGCHDFGSNDPLFPAMQALAAAGGHVSGLCIDVDEQALQNASVQLRAWGFPHVAVVRQEVTPSNIVSLLGSVPMVDVLKIDIDGMDCAVLSAVLDSLPRPPGILIVEVLYDIPPPWRFARRYAPEWPLSEWQAKWIVERLLPGCNLGYLVTELQHYDYYLYKYNGADTIFVHSTHLAAFRAADGTVFPVDELLCYLMASIHTAMPTVYIKDWLGLGPSHLSPLDMHDALLRIWGNITEIQHGGGAERMPFLLDYPGRNQRPEQP
eukprot:gnl/TRDRNA2_/TRDRNA2_116518_c1_seq1.p1 gnl/TRDRNA2_/TRDRNA2_116518_c1~~gnl/TRDRNA2_/TRDRNA2_116518_c1_seq1.p1  ORF type:complete len:416 (-),score=45.68 gnl/TRDRNA2_/TRDRNA2_116518_c1_seq1:88-1335(-)